MLHIGYWEETGKRQLMGMPWEWAEYMRKKSNKSLYYFLRRNHYDKEYLCEILTPILTFRYDDRTEEETYNGLMNKTYMQIIEQHREDLIDGIEEEIGEIC